MTVIKTDLVLDAKGMACPMPIVKTKKAINGLEAGQVLEIQATDKGSRADLKAWAQSSGHQYLGTIEEGGVLKHYLRKSSNDEALERKYPHVISNMELEKKLASNKGIIVLDVREAAEFAFHHIPKAISIPFGELEERLAELDKDWEIYVVCRTGNRSDYAAQRLAESGFVKVFNVMPGMCEWTGPAKGLTN